MSTSDLTSATKSRPSWDDYFINVVATAAQRATCDRGRSGAIIVYQRQIIATGYVGSPPGFPHCDDIGHELVDGHCVRTVHAEQNAIASAARYGISTLGTTLYSTMMPCRMCAMLLLTAGIDRVLSAHAYRDNSGYVLLRRAGIDAQFLDASTLYDA